MVTSELVTNAIRAGADLIVLELDANSTGLYIAVTDDAAGEVIARIPRALDTSGRGLHIVAAIAQRWGVDALPAGKRVWAELPAPGSVFDGLPAGLSDVAS
jgi:anti-sigma regulatory factor (Ser/Thr protein kinase)